MRPRSAGILGRRSRRSEQGRKPGARQDRGWARPGLCVWRSGADWRAKRWGRRAWAS